MTTDPPNSSFILSRCWGNMFYFLHNPHYDSSNSFFIVMSVSVMMMLYCPSSLLLIVEYVVGVSVLSRNAKAVQFNKDFTVHNMSSTPEVPSR